MLNRMPPYKALLTHGFVVDGGGHKMSKSLGNVIAPQEISTGIITAMVGAPLFVQLVRRRAR